MADEPKTDGTGTVTGTTPQTVDKPATTGSGEKTPEHVPYDRFQGVVAERNREKERADKLETEHKKLIDQHKTEDQKRIDAAAKAIVEAEYGPVKTRLERIETGMKVELQTLLEKIPEAHRVAIDQNAPVETQLMQARVYAEIAGGSKPAAKPINGGGDPPADRPKTYSAEQYWNFLSLAGSPDPNDRKRYSEGKEEMFQARKEGRIIGLAINA